MKCPRCGGPMEPDLLETDLRPGTGDQLVDVPVWFCLDYTCSNVEPREVA